MNTPLTFGNLDEGIPFGYSSPMRGSFGHDGKGGGKIGVVKRPVNMEIIDGKRTKVVHINQLQYRMQPQCGECDRDTSSASGEWSPSQVENIVIPPMPPEAPPPWRYPLRQRYPPGRFMN